MKRTLSLLIVIICFFAMNGCRAKQEKAVINETEISSIELKQDKENVLIAYFSRYGNTEDSESVDVSTSASIVSEEENLYGTTEFIAREIQKKTDGDLHLIETMQPYPSDFDELRDLNHQEKANQILPELAESDLDLTQYDIIFIGYPVWASSLPQAVVSFVSENDLADKIVIPFCTHDGYGSGTSYEQLQELLSQSEIKEGISIEASEVSESSEVISNWLSGLEIEKNQAEETNIVIEIDGNHLEGILYNSDIAEEIKTHLPLTVTMNQFGGREYYGPISFVPENDSNGQLYFENGDITYCSQNNTMAIFYAQTEQPDLTMEVVPIGKVISDLSIFDHLPSQVEIIFSVK